MNHRIAFFEYQKPVRNDYLEPEVPLAFVFFSHSLKKAGFETKLFSYWEGRHDFNQFLREVVEYEPAIIALNGTFGVFAADMAEILGKIKSRIPQTTSIFGGCSVTASPEAFLNNPNIDFICLGEGDEVFIDFCRSISNQEKPTAIPGIYSKADFGQRPLQYPTMEDLSEVDLDLDLLNWNQYVVDSEGRRVLRSLQTSRGCPFSCYFCYRSKVKVKYRLFELHKILKWVDAIHAKTGFDTIQVVDDHFFVNKKWAFELIHELHQRGIGLTSLDLRMEDITDDLFSVAVDKGVKSVFVGLESSNDRLLKGMNKKTTRAMIDRALSVIQRWPKLTVTAQLILALPGMEDKELLEAVGYAIDRLKDTPNFNIGFVVYMPLPGSVFYNQIAEQWPQYQDKSLESLRTLSTMGRFNMEWSNISQPLRDKVYRIRELFSLYAYVYRASQFKYQRLSRAILLKPFFTIYAGILEWRLRHLKGMWCTWERKALSRLFGYSVGYK